MLGLVDPDLDKLEGRDCSTCNVMTWEAHDLEVALICSTAFDRLLVEYGSQGKIQSLGAEVRELVLASAATVGYLRWASARNGLDLRFQGLDLKRYMDVDSLNVDLVRLCRAVIDRSQKPWLDEHEVAEAAEALRDDSHDKGHVCCGDDAVQILSIGLRSAFGTRRARDVNVDRLKQSLRMAFEGAGFRRSSVGTSIQEWEGRNRGYVVLR